MVKINPIFAAFEFTFLKQARDAWKACEDDPEVRNVSVWSSNPGTPVIVILGERQEDVDRAAAVVMACIGCRGDFILPDPLKTFFVNRRYGTLLAEAQRRVAAGESVEDINAAGGIRQRMSDQPETPKENS